ncbi:MAG: hypothetical protein IJB70_09985 [Clostridia bacterium]|nr:hypothetical protein [Clostridia bacterium]
MIKKILTVVCISTMLMLFPACSVVAADNQPSTIEYAFEIVMAKPDADLDSVSVRLLQCEQTFDSAVVIGLFYDENGSFTEFVISPVTDFDSIVTLCPTKAYSSGKVTVWKSLSSVKPIAKTVEIGYEATASYTIEYYRQNVERNGYDLYETSSPINVTVGESVSLDTLTLPTYDGFSFDGENSANVLTGIVTTDGLTLKVYYNHVYDDAEMVQVKYRLEKVNGVIKKYSGNFTDDEKAILKVIKTTIDKVLADADAGALIYLEGYVLNKYPDEVADAREKLDALKELGGFADFKSKLAQYTSLADVEYLAKVLFGIDDIYQYEKDYL